MTLDPVRAWLNAEDVLRNARAYAARLMVEALPIGKVVDVSRGRGCQTVKILDHSVGGRRIKVLNIRTRKEYWLGSFWFEPRHGGDPT